jgi:cytochrome c2
MESAVTAVSALAIAWLAALPALALAQGGLGDARRGALLIAQYQCGACHVVPGIAAARGAEGPPLTAYGLRSYIAGRVPNRPALLARWIAQPSSLVPSTTMPDLGVPEQDARDMAAWLSELR